MELNPDIQTGRNVYADKDLYESDDTYKAKIDGYVNEGFKLVYGSPDDPSEGGGGAEPLIVELTFDGQSKFITNKTWREINNAFNDGRNVFISISRSDTDSGDSWMWTVLAVLYCEGAEPASVYVLNERTLDPINQDVFLRFGGESKDSTLYYQYVD